MIALRWSPRHIHTRWSEGRCETANSLDRLDGGQPRQQFYQARRHNQPNDCSAQCRPEVAASSAPKVPAPALHFDHLAKQSSYAFAIEINRIPASIWHRRLQFPLSLYIVAINPRHCSALSRRSTAHKGISLKSDVPKTRTPARSV
jgi:hypothetical protein